MKINLPPPEIIAVPCMAGNLIRSEARVWRYGDLIRMRVGCYNVELEQQHALRLARCLQAAVEQGLDVVPDAS
jgi:hypothetical protein